ncbi:MAG: hypothetical protein NUV69_05675 [Candidatus Curtissbacteria bacterium]|nr:hypothetical protein [Candidatus Curtissbacteria bacterium]
MPESRETVEAVPSVVEIPPFNPARHKEMKNAMRDYVNNTRRAKRAVTELKYNEIDALDTKRSNSLQRFWSYSDTIVSGLYQNRDEFNSSFEALDYTCLFEDSNGFRQRAVDVIESNIIPIKRKMGKGITKAFELSLLLIEHGTDAQRHLGLTVIGQNLGVLSRAFSGSALADSYSDVLAQVASLDPEAFSSAQDEFVIDAAKKMVVAGLRSLDTTKARTVSAGVTLLAKLNKRTKPLFEQEALPSFLERIGLPPEATVEAWKLSSKEWSDQSTISFDPVLDNLRSIGDLEYEIPGICSYLSSNFGIYDFGRYPEQMLIKQFKEADNKNLPYGVVLFPRSDWNGSFNNKWQALRGLFESLGDDYLVRVVEADSKIDISRMLRRLDRKYGKNQKISFAVIGGHGTPTTIQFGDPTPRTDRSRGLWYRRHIIDTRDFQDPRILGLPDYLIKNPTLILVSCSTGFVGGIGHQLSEMLSATVIAPSGDTFLRSIKAQNTNGRLSFSVEYGDPNIAQLFEGGRQETTKR